MDEQIGEEPTQADRDSNGTAPLPSTVPERPRVFISYRVVPDERVAGAVQRLLEASLDPAPEVFVSGLGGLRPSSMGFKPQLQRAVQKAQAFIGIVTEASKDREWIFYEAGAAWGRGAVYVPLLVGVSPGDLPNSIADYQAYRAGEREDVERLITGLAAELNCKAKSRFGARFGAFTRQLEEHRRGLLGEDPEDDSNPSAEASKLMREGRIAEANDAFDKLIKEATEPEDIARFKVERLLLNPNVKPLDMLSELDTFDAALKATTEYALWFGLFESRPLAATTALRQALATLPEDSARRGYLVTELAKQLELSGHREEAVEILVKGLRGAASRQSRAQAAKALADMKEPLVSKYARLLALAEATLAFTTEELADATTDAAADIECTYLRVYSAKLSDARAETGHSAHEAGRALEQAGLKSLAFRAYSRALEKGVSVGRVNAARLLARGPVPAAGLTLLEQHAGPFDAASPGYPHETRAELEAELARERDRLDELEKGGRRLCTMLAEFAERTIGAQIPHPMPKTLEFAVEDRALYEHVDLEEDAELQSPFRNIWLIDVAKDRTGLLGYTVDGAWIGMAFSVSDCEVEPVWAAVTANDT